MYEQVFHFNSRPFTSTPFVKHYFSGDSIDHSLGQAKVCIDRASGPVMVVGGAGTGKSLLLALLEDQYHSQFNVVNLACGKLEERQDLLQSILFELKQPYQGLTDSELRFALMDYLNPGEHCPHGVLLLIDEAHLLSQEMLDEIRLITNFIRDGEPRVRLVLAGNQRLEENLMEPKLESFNQRIAARCYLSNMNREETAQYVIEHVKRAGGSDLFDETSLKAIHEVSDGCPRLINQVCDHALILAATRGESVISGQCVLEAWSDVQSIPGDWATPATQPDSVSEIQNDESWTVIEFGQLDDSEQAEQGTVYDFENSQSATDSTSSHADDDSDVEPVSETVQTETEKQAEATEIEGQASEALKSQFAVAGSEESEPDHESMQSFHQDADDEAFPPINDFVNQSADEMEAQLNAVFGDGLKSTQSGQEKEISEMEAEQEALLDQVESAKLNAQSEDASLTLGDQLKAAISGLNDEPSESHADEFASVESEQFKALEVNEEVETSCENSDRESGDIRAESWQEEDDESRPEEPDGETDDPFAEDFLEEEHLVDRYAPFVAHQNQSSLTLTSSDLALIRPLDLEDRETSSDDPQEAFAQDVKTFEPFASGDKDGLELTSPTVDIIEAEDSEELAILDHDSKPLTHDGSSTIVEPDELDPPRDEDESSIRDQFEQFAPSANEQPSTEIQQTIVLDQQVNSFSNTEQGLSTADDDAAFGAVTQPSDKPSNSAAVEPSVTDSPENESDMHENDPPASSAEIERQAEEILQRLGISQHVSCETEPADASGSATGNSRQTHTPTIVLHTNDDDHQETAPRGTHSEPTLVLDNGTVGPTEFERQSAALDETQQILNEILAQKNLLASQRLDSEFDESTSSTETHDDPLELTETPTSSQAEATQEKPPTDDREMIILNETDEPAEPKTPKSQPISFPSDQISKGRAERMDYQKLFDQLRDISNSKK